MSYPSYPMLTDATRKRLSRCLDYHDGGSPTHEDVQALWRAYTEVEAERGQAQGQIDRLANFIMQEIPGEPSQSEGAIDTAIRLLKRTTRLVAAVALAITHIDGQATKFSEREPVAVLYQLRAARGNTVK